MPRPPATPRSPQTRVLIRSRRRCCLCVGLHGDESVKQGRIAHVDGNRVNNDESNLVFLCSSHHDDYGSTAFGSSGITPSEVRQYRDLLYRRVRSRLGIPAPDVPWPPKALRVGLSWGLLQEREGDVEFSQTFVKSLCHQAEQRAGNPDEFAREEGWQDMLITATCEAKDAGVPGFEDELRAFLTELGLPITDYLSRVASAASIVRLDDRGDMTLDRELVDELRELLGNRGTEVLGRPEKVRTLFLRLGFELARSRLLIATPERRNHAWLVARFLMIFFSRWISELEGVAGEMG